MKRLPGSFRDPAGAVYDDGERIARTISAAAADAWTRAQPLLADAVARGLVTPFHEIEPFAGSWKSIAVERIPFISYPYEWCFSQLRDAALLTLDLQRRALAAGQTLKDASAYNVQFCGARPVFIDLLSFEPRAPGEPWSAYRQFCMHFLAPLALQAYVDDRLGRLSRLWVDGIPLALAAKLLPARTWLRFGLASHLHAHARYERRFGDARRVGERLRTINVKTSSLIAIADSLAATIKALRPPRAETEWAGYYTDTNYSAGAAECKYDFVARHARARPGELAMDLGANTGRYSAALAGSFRTVLAVDTDALAVERHYLHLRSHGPDGILPLVMDLANPSPGIGWAGRERDSFAARARVDFLAALALVHHLVITAGIPLPMVAGHFAELVRPGGTLILEFVPKEDSQTRRLLAARRDVFPDYSREAMLAAFSPAFALRETLAVPESLRTLHVFARR